MGPDSRAGNIFDVGLAVPEDFLGSTVTCGHVVVISTLCAHHLGGIVEHVVDDPWRALKDDIIVVTT